MLFPPTGKARKHPPAITNVDGNPNDSTPLKSKIDPANVLDQSLLCATFDNGNDPKSFKVKLTQSGAEFLPSPKNLLLSSKQKHKATNKRVKPPVTKTPIQKTPLLPPLIQADGTWV